MTIERRIGGREVRPEMRAPALLAEERGVDDTGGSLRDIARFDRISVVPGTGFDQGSLLGHFRRCRPKTFGRSHHGYMLAHGALDGFDCVLEHLPVASPKLRSKSV